MLKMLIRETENVVLETQRQPTNREIIEAGLQTATVQGNEKAVRFWQRSKAHLEQVETKGGK